MSTVFSILLIIDALFMIVTVLMQSSDDDGMSALSGRTADSYFSKSKAKTMEARLALGTKIAAGIMQTHSHTADGRREAIITQLARMEAPLELIEAVYASATTDAAAAAIREAGFDRVWDALAEAARRYCALRVRGEMRVDIVFVDGQGHILGKSDEVKA